MSSAIGASLPDDIGVRAHGRVPTQEPERALGTAPCLDTFSFGNVPNLPHGTLATMGASVGLALHAIPAAGGTVGLTGAVERSHGQGAAGGGRYGDGHRGAVYASGLLSAVVDVGASSGVVEKACPGTRGYRALGPDLVGQGYVHSTIPPQVAARG